MELDQLYVIGVDQTAPIEIREKVSFDKRILEVLDNIKANPGVSEAVALSTCHRSEIYTIVEDVASIDLEKLFCNFLSSEDEKLKPYIFLYQGLDAVKHIFRVAAGLESMVVGEDQILGQVKEALDAAQKAGASGKILNRLFLDAITLGKNARSSTGISENSLSISYISILFIQEVFQDLSDKTAYVIGAGEMGRLAILHLLARGIGKVLVSNRTMERALELKQQIPEITVVPYEQKYEKIVGSDILISATNAPHYTVSYEKFKDSFKKDRICIVDIALPRDIDPAIGQLKGVNLYTVDDLQRTAKENQRKREGLVSIIENMVDESVEKFTRWVNGLCMVPILRAMKDYADTVCFLEYEQLLNKISHVDDQDKGKIKVALERVAMKIVDNYLLDLKGLVETEEIDKGVLSVFMGGGLNK